MKTFLPQRCQRIITRLGSDAASQGARQLPRLPNTPSSSSGSSSWGAELRLPAYRPRCPHPRFTLFLLREYLLIL